MSKIATKIAGVALATVMMVGGMTVFAAEPGDEVCNNTFRVTATRDSIFSYFTYQGDTKTFIAPETGSYNFRFTSEESGDYTREVFIHDSQGNTLASNCGHWESTTIPGINLTAGEEYIINFYADDFMGWTFSYSGDAYFIVSVTLDEKFEEEVVPEVIDEPEIIDEPEVIEEPEIIEESDVIITPEIITEATQKPVETIAPAIPRLTVEQIRSMSIRNFVGHLYLEGLGRNISVEETNYWVDMMLNQDVSATEAATMILTSSEITDREMTDEEYASILNDVFDTDSEEEILSQFNYGASVQTVIEDLAGTDEWTSKCAFYGVNV